MSWGAFGILVAARNTGIRKMTARKTLNITIGAGSRIGQGGMEQGGAQDGPGPLLKLWAKSRKYWDKHRTTS